MPDQVRASAFAHDTSGNALHSPAHLGGCSARERQQHDTSGIGSAHNEMRHAVSQGIRLAGACPGYDEEWWSAIGKNCAAVFYGAALFRI